MKPPSTPPEVDPPRSELRERLATVPDPLTLLEGLFAHSPVPYLIFTSDGHPLLANPAYREMFGAVPPREYNVLRDELAEKLNIAEAVRSAFAGQTVTTPPVWYDPRLLQSVTVTEARRAAISLACFPLRDASGTVTHVAIAYRDVTAEWEERERTHAEKDALAESNRRLRDVQGELQQALKLAERAEHRTQVVTSNATLGLLMMDARQRCVFMNAAAERIVGFTHQELEGQPLHQYVHHTRPDGRPYPMEECPIDRALPTQNSQQGEEVFVRRDGTFYPVAFTASPIYEDGQPVGTVIELRDTTEEKRRDAERSRLLMDLERAVHVREQFLTVASHELRTPLTPLTLKLQQLQRSLQAPGAALEKAPLLLDTALKQVERLSALVEELLDVSRIGVGRLQLQVERVDLAQVARELVVAFDLQAQQAHSSFVLDADVPVVGSWDRLRIEQVVTNLLDNAVKYGGGKPISVRVEQRGGRALLTVKDQGIGIAESDLSRIFERFERAVSPQNYSGLGLGLYITRELVLAHGGEITVRSAPTEGTEFLVSLPLG